jgi:outer membrane protein OmpA-like peptidoglycan-associated protein
MQARAVLSILGLLLLPVAAGLGCAPAPARAPEPPPQPSSTLIRRAIPFEERYLWSTSVEPVHAMGFVARVDRSALVSVSDRIASKCGDDIPNPRFEFDSSELTRDSHPELRALAHCLTSGPLRGRNVTIVGNADPRGDFEDNFILGEKRAEEVKDFLATHGVPRGRILVVSRGEIGAVGRGEGSWTEDRRVDIHLAGEAAR